MTKRPSHVTAPKKLNIAVIGSGIAGLSSAWLLSHKHQVTLFEADHRLGGHSHTVNVLQADSRFQPVDTGFIVYNERTYPNLTALFRHLGVATEPAEMTFGVSLDNGRLEYAGTDLRGLLAQPLNLFRPRFWMMIKDLLRFYREAPADVAQLQEHSAGMTNVGGMPSLGDYLDSKGYGRAFREDHLYPMAAAIWSTPAADIASYPAASFIRFCDNHGLLKIKDRPVWRTVSGGSRAYVERLSQSFAERIVTGFAVEKVERDWVGVTLTDARGHSHRFDQVVLACHADQALALLAAPSPEEQRLLSAFAYSRNEAVLHTDPAVMPRRRRVWSSWNYMTQRGETGQRLSVTYWMNRLQNIPDATPYFVTLNPLVEPREERVIKRQVYEHPLFDAAAMAAQRELWSLQGQQNSWFCGAYFGAGFHEDGLQAGLAVAEALGDVRRPWRVDEESSRIFLPISSPPPEEAA